MTVWLVVSGLGGIAALAIVAWGISVRRDRKLRIGERGILARESGLGWIGWDEIEGAYLPDMGHPRELRLKVRFTRRIRRLLRERAARRARVLPDGESVLISLDLGGSDVHASDVLHEILAHRQ